MTERYASRAFQLERERSRSSAMVVPYVRPWIWFGLGAEYSRLPMPPTTQAKPQKKAREGQERKGAGKPGLLQVCVPMGLSLPLWRGGEEEWRPEGERGSVASFSFRAARDCLAGPETRPGLAEGEQPARVEPRARFRRSTSDDDFAFSPHLILQGRQPRPKSLPIGGQRFG